MATGYIFSVTVPSKQIEKDMIVIKPGTICSYIIGDLKPCIEADVLIDGKSVHIDRALFDTGSNITAINPRIAPAVSSTNGDKMVIHGTDRSGEAVTHYCSICLGSGEIVLQNVPVQAFDLDIYDHTDIDLIIGMNVITLGELSVKKKGFLPIFTFSIEK